MKAHPCKYIVKEDFDYNPSYGDTTDEKRTTHFKKGEVYEFEPYLGKCHKEGEMSLVTHILPEMNNHFVWKAEFFNEHFVRQITALDSFEAFMTVVNRHRPYEPSDFIPESYTPDL